MLRSGFAPVLAIPALVLCAGLATAQQPPPATPGATATPPAPPAPAQPVAGQPGATATPPAPPAPAQPVAGQPPAATPPTAQPTPPYPYPYAQPYPYPYPGYPYPYTYPQPYPQPYPGQVGPARIPYEEGQPTPAGYRETTETRKGLIIGGAVTLGVTWTMTLLSAALIDAVRNADRDPGEPRDDGATPLFIPVVGPFIAISTLDAEGSGTSLLLLDGIAQGAGAAMLIAGITVKRKVWVRQVGGVQLQLAPVALDSRNVALGLDGRF